METPIHERHDLDEQGRPAGGVTVGRGFTIAWQHGPLAEGLIAPNECVNPEHFTGRDPRDGAHLNTVHTLCRRAPNGAFVEDVIAAAIGRLEHYQATEFACSENAEALAALRFAAEALRYRTRNRETRGVEGTHQP